NSEDVNRLLHQVGKDVGIAGRVVLLLEVGEDGSVGDVRVRRSSGHMALDAAVVQVARSARFHPALVERQPLPVWLELPFTVVVRKRCCEPAPADGRPGRAASGADRSGSGPPPYRDDGGTIPLIRM
ncbi:MAG TPA: energy transducer TonB, partial [Longimicrobiales bacterium]|nr:energy transducer TonB [Longimicrobiales bacterium]